MTDKLWLLDTPSMERTRETNRRVLGALPRAPQRRRRIYDGGSTGSGGVLTIRFQLVDPVFCEACTASADVISRPPGMSTVPEEVAGRVIVVDRLGCFLNEPSESLVGRVGYATYLTVDPAHEIGPCPGLPTTAWEIISLCCYENGC